MGALCELYCKSMVVLRRLLLPLLPPMLMQLTRIFGGMPLPAPLECVTQAVEAYGKEDDESPAACALSDALAALVESVCAHLSSGQDAEGRPELLTSFFELCHRTLVFAPGLLLSLPSADALFDAAIGCVTHQEFTHTRAALTFVCLFIAGTESAGPYRETSACCLQKSGARLLLQSLRGLAALSPDNLIDHQAECLRVLVDACPSAIQQWLVAALSDWRRAALRTAHEPRTAHELGGARAGADARTDASVGALAAGRQAPRGGCERAEPHGRRNLSIQKR